MGRPSKPYEERRAEKLEFRVTAFELQTIKLAARIRGERYTQFARAAVLVKARHAIAHPEQDDDE